MSRKKKVEEPVKVEPLSELGTEQPKVDDEQVKAEQKMMKQEIDELTPKVEKVSKEIVDVLQKNELSPIQAIIMLRSLIEGIMEKVMSEAQKQEASVAS